MVEIINEKKVPKLLNLGCGFKKFEDHINVDKYEICQPDVLQDLDVFPYMWEDNSIDGIEMHHVLEHIPNWWQCFCECARILKPGGYLNIRVPDESSSSAGTWRDHFHIFTPESFHGIQEVGHGTSAWGKLEQDKIPLKLIRHDVVPFPRFQWMAKFCPGLLKFCAKHLRNFIHEQRFSFIKVIQEVGNE